MNKGAQLIVDFYTNGPGKFIFEDIVRKTIMEIELDGHNNSTHRIYEEQAKSPENSST